MPAPSYTYTLTNGSTADASQVTQNFNDILNGVTDGTKNLSISALTVGGAATLNGAMNFGSASDDDITILGSLASSFPVKTNTSYDIGSATLGLRSVYIGGTSTYSTRILGAATASWTLTLPVDVPTVTSSYLGATTGGVTSWIEPVLDSPVDANNYTLTATVGSSALTIALKTKAGNDPTAAAPVYIAFRNATIATGDYTVVKATAATSVVVSNGSTLGHVSTVASYFYVYAINNAGTIELAVSTKLFDEGTVQTSTTEGGAGGADTATTLYSTTGRTAKAIRLLARLISTQTTAGTWAAVPTEISLGSKWINGDSILGVTDSSAGTAGYIGERISSGAPSDVSIGTGSFTTITSITLTPGTWDLSFNAYATGTASTTACTVGIATATNSSTGFVAGDNYIAFFVNGSVNDNAGGLGNAYRVSISTSTTYYLTSIRAGATGNVRGRISGVRVR